MLEFQSAEKGISGFFQPTLASCLIHSNPVSEKKLTVDVDRVVQRFDRNPRWPLAGPAIIWNKNCGSPRAWSKIPASSLSRNTPASTSTLCGRGPDRTERAVAGGPAGLVTPVAAACRGTDEITGVAPDPRHDRGDGTVL
jgi:hypothetical protein